MQLRMVPPEEMPSMLRESASFPKVRFTVMVTVQFSMRPSAAPLALARAMPARPLPAAKVSVSLSVLLRVTFRLQMVPMLYSKSAPRRL